MDLLEYQGKQLFAKHGVPVPEGRPASTVAEAVEAAEALGYPVVIKAQVQIGGRGKAGGIKLAKDRAEAEENATAILGMDIRGFTVQELYVEHGEKRFGPYAPVGGPIPLHKYRKFKKSTAEERADRVAALAESIGLPRAALSGGELPPLPSAMPTTKVAFSDPDPFQTLAFPSTIAAKRAVADELGLALAKLAPEDRAFIDALVHETLDKPTVLARVRAHFKHRAQGG